MILAPDCVSGTEFLLYHTQIGCELTLWVCVYPRLEQSQKDDRNYVCSFRLSSVKCAGSNSTSCHVFKSNRCAHLKPSLSQLVFLYGRIDPIPPLPAFSPHTLLYTSAFQNGSRLSVCAPCSFLPLNPIRPQSCLSASPLPRHAPKQLRGEIMFCSLRAFSLRQKSDQPCKMADYEPKNTFSSTHVPRLKLPGLHDLGALHFSLGQKVMFKSALQALDVFRKPTHQSQPQKKPYT